MKLTPKSKILINRAIQRIYTRLKRDFGSYQQATIIICLHHQTLANSDESGVKISMAHDLRIGFVQEPAMLEHEIWIMAKDVTYIRSDGQVTDPLCWYQIQDEKLSLYVKNEKYNEKIILK